MSHVYDGDTVKLTDGRKLRFIGINTPEIKHDGSLSEPFAVAARERLVQLIGEGPIRLLYGNERHDRYGRLLAHPYLDDGRSINAILLQEGLATTLVVPPNSGNFSCYREAEWQARDMEVGIWSLPRYHPISPEQLLSGEAGYRRVQAVVEEVVEGPRSVWLELTGPMALKISRKDLANFSGWDLGELVGRKVIASGWPWLHEGKWYMRLRHPAALEIRSDD